jgi:hypothetical protein
MIGYSLFDIRYSSTSLNMPPTLQPEERPKTAMGLWILHIGIALCQVTIIFAGGSMLEHVRSALEPAGMPLLSRLYASHWVRLEAGCLVLAFIVPAFAKSEAYLFGRHRYGLRVTMLLNVMLAIQSAISALALDVALASILLPSGDLRELRLSPK